LTYCQQVFIVDNKSTGVSMHVISRRPFNDAVKKHPNQRQALEDLYRVLRSSHFSSPDEMRQVFPSLDNFKYKDKW